MPSFGYGVTLPQPNSRSLLVSFSQHSSVGLAPPGPSSASNSSTPRSGCSISAPVGPSSSPPPGAPPSPPPILLLLSAILRVGFCAPSSQDQVLRNHAVGRTCSVSASGPALVTVI